MKNDLYQARSWLVTQPADGAHGMSHERLLETLESAHLSAVGQLEKGGKTGYLHWQLLVERESGAPIRFSRLRAIFPHGHYEPRRGTLIQAIDYVTKPDTRACPRCRFPGVKYGATRENALIWTSFTMRLRRVRQLRRSSLIILVPAAMPVAWRLCRTRL